MILNEERNSLSNFRCNLMSVLEMFFEEPKILRYSRKLTVHVDNNKLARILQILGSVYIH